VCTFFGFQHFSYIFFGCVKSESENLEQRTGRAKNEEREREREHALLLLFFRFFFARIGLSPAHTHSPSRSLSNGSCSLACSGGVL